MSARLGALRLAPAADAPPGEEREEARWADACALDDIVPDTGVCALLDQRQVALVRVGRGERVYALDNFDPVARAFVLSRGIVGDAGGTPKIASPINKRCYDLRTGRCLDDASIGVAVWDVRVREGRVEVRLARGGAS